jgi:hypothetical protein
MYDAKSNLLELEDSRSSDCNESTLVKASAALHRTFPAAHPKEVSLGDE